MEGSSSPLASDGWLGRILSRVFVFQAPKEACQWLLSLEDTSDEVFYDTYLQDHGDEMEDVNAFRTEIVQKSFPLVLRVLSFVLPDEKLEKHRRLFGMINKPPSKFFGTAPFLAGCEGDRRSRIYRLSLQSLQELVNERLCDRYRDAFWYEIARLSLLSAQLMRQQADSWERVIRKNCWCPGGIRPETKRRALQFPQLIREWVGELEEFASDILCDFQ